jgi:hypothetical protein
VQEQIAAFAAAERIPVLDLLPVLRPMGESSFLDYDHLSASGARRVADALAESTLLGTRPDAGHAARNPGITVQARDAAASRIPPLERLRDPDPATRAATARALGNAGAEAASVVPALVHALKDSDPSVRAGAGASGG